MNQVLRKRGRARWSIATALAVSWGLTLAPGCSEGPPAAAPGEPGQAGPSKVVDMPTPKSNAPGAPKVLDMQ